MLNYLYRMPFGKKKRPMIETTEQALEALASLRKGRGKDVADILRIAEASVSIMRNRGKIWRAHHGPVLLLLTHAGYEVNTEALFGYSVETLLSAEVTQREPELTSAA